MLLTKKECQDIIDDLHKIYDLVDYEVIDSFTNKERIKIHFINTKTGRNYEGIFEKGEKVTKTSFEFKEIINDNSSS